MLHSLLPKAHAKALVLPLLGSIADGFDDWLAATGYTAGSRRNAIRMLPQVDTDLRKRRVRRTLRFLRSVSTCGSMRIAFLREPAVYPVAASQSSKPSAIEPNKGSTSALAWAFGRRECSIGTSEK